MEKGYGLLKGQGGSADAVQHLAAVEFLFVLNVGVFFSLQDQRQTPTVTKINSF